MVLQITPNCLIGDEVVLECIKVDSVAFETTLDPSRLSAANLVVGQQPIGVLNLAVQILDIRALLKMEDSGGIVP
jgi:hypothetical protein